MDLGDVAQVEQLVCDEEAGRRLRVGGLDSRDCVQPLVDVAGVERRISEQVVAIRYAPQNPLRQLPMKASCQPPTR